MKPFATSPANIQEPEIERTSDFDQTAAHDHRPNVTCPAGDWPKAEAEADAKGPRHVSPAILEYRIEELERELAERDKRISQLEGLVENFARAIDMMDSNTIFITGNSLNEIAAAGIEKDPNA